MIERFLLLAAALFCAVVPIVLFFARARVRAKGAGLTVSVFCLAGLAWTASALVFLDAKPADLYYAGIGGFHAVARGVCIGLVLDGVLVRLCDRLSAGKLKFVLSLLFGPPSRGTPVEERKKRPGPPAWPAP